MDLQYACGGDPRERRRQALVELAASAKSVVELHLSHLRTLRSVKTESIEVALLTSSSLLLDVSAVVRIVEGSFEAVAFQQAALNAELILPLN